MSFTSPLSIGASAVTDEADLLTTVETFLADRRRAPAFPAWLEARFERERGGDIGRWLARDTIKTAVIYNLLIFADLQLAPDVLGLACLIHLAVATPLMLAAAALLWRGLPRPARQIAGVLAPLLVVAHIVVIYGLSRAPSAPNYLYFVTLAMLFAQTTMRLDYRSARWLTMVALALLVGGLAFRAAGPASAGLLPSFVFLLGALISLDGAMRRERELRLGYVRNLGDRLRLAASASEARRDALTGLANRRRLEEAAAALWRNARSNDRSPVSAILLDVDRFKAYNDAYGHQAGDLCLQRIAQRLAGEVASREMVLARYGGEEFLLLAPRTGLDEAQRIAERFRRAILDLAILHSDSDGRGLVSASFGVATLAIADGDFKTLTAAADAALYTAKATGRNRVCLASAPR